MRDRLVGRAFDVPDQTISRQMLHAALLAFDHTITGEPMVLTAPPREDMLALVAHLRTHTTATANPGGCVPLERLGVDA